MAYTKGKKTNAKRTYKKKKMMRRKANYSFNNAGSSMPLKLKHKVNFRYFDGATVSPGAGGIVNYYTIRANSLFDPDVTNVGHQPAGYDELMALYAKYQVIGSKIRVQFQNSDINDPIAVGIFVSTDATPTAQLTGLIEGGAVKYKTLGFGSQAQSVSLTASANIKKRFGITGSFLGEDVYAAASNANPTSILYFHIFLASPINGTPASIPIQFQIDYVAILTDPLSLVSS